MVGHAEVDAVVFDLDGVVRRFDPTHRTEIERRAGLASDEMRRAAFAEPLLTDVTTGRITRSQWVSRVGAAIGDPQAAADWLAERGEIAPGMSALLDALAEAPVPVAILTNGTDTVEDELRHLGLHDRFDHVFNSHFLGVRKPSVEVYRLVAEALDLPPERIWFTDDTEPNVASAAAFGFRAERFVDAATAASSLRRHGVLADGR